MIEYFGLDNIIYLLLVLHFITVIGLDARGRYLNKIIDKLQNRVDDLERRIGLSSEFDMDPIGFVRNQDHNKE